MRNTAGPTWIGVSRVIPFWGSEKSKACGKFWPLSEHTSIKRSSNGQLCMRRTDRAVREQTGGDVVERRVVLGDQRGEIELWVEDVFDHHIAFREQVLLERSGQYWHAQRSSCSREVVSTHYRTCPFDQVADWPADGRIDPRACGILMRYG